MKLKEEAALYAWIRGAQDTRPFNVIVKALIRAVRADERKLIEQAGEIELKRAVKEWNAIRKGK